MLGSTDLRTTMPAATRLRGLARALVALPISCFGALLLTYAVNVPWMDDLDAFLRFLLGFTNARSVGEKVDWLLRPNNEHRMLTGKLLALGLYKLAGVVNFRWLILLAAGFLAGTLWLLYRVFRWAGLPLPAFVPVPFLLLQPQYHLTSLWAITGLQHEVVTCEVLTALYWLSGLRRRAFAGAVAMQGLASFSMSNGLFGWVAGAALLTAQGRWRRLAVWLVVGAGAIGLYFHDFANGQGNEGAVDFWRHYPYLVVSGFFTFAGALADFFSDAPILRRSLLPTAFGLVLIRVVAELLWRMNEPRFRRPWTAAAPFTDHQRSRYFFTGAYVFLLVNAAVIALLRPRFGYGVLLVSNYMLYPALLACLVYLNGLTEWRGLNRRRWLRVGLVAGGLVWGVHYVRLWPRVAERQQTLLAFAQNQQRNDVGLGATLGTPFADLARRVLTDAQRRGMYQYPTDQFVAIPPAATDDALRWQIGSSDYSDLVETLDYPLPPTVRRAWVVVQSDRHTFLFGADTPFRPGPFFLNRPLRGIRAEVLRGMLYPGTYRVGLLLDAAGPTLRFGRQTIAVANRPDRAP